MESKLSSSLNFPMMGSQVIGANKKPNTEAYTDLSALNKLKVSARQNEDEALPKVAKQFESLLIAMLIKTMRDSTLSEDSMFKSDAGDSYQSMHDQQLALELAKGDGIGLSESIIRQLKKDKQKTVTPIETAPLKPFNLNKNANQADLKMPEQRMFGEITSKMKQLLLDTKEVLDSKESVKTYGEGEKPTGNQLTIDKISNDYNDIQQSLSDELKQNRYKLESLDFSSPKKFVESLWPMAQKSAQSIGVSPEVLVAQAALETGWGQSIIQNKAKNSFNLFNIKADSRWSGDKMEKSSLEYEKGIAVKRSSDFRAYDDVQQSFDDYVNFIKNNPRYKNALSVSENPEQYLHEIHKAGYATDPNYAKKIIQVMNSDHIQDITDKKTI
ncbi:MAG: flagellar assembly peptidoglycan hydrolase FlgJ [Gammaproteobacteria bacterium]|nr:flagellar assembly peptidoglycan hydrolase FlgJ [Gammaproteobacteria bacterium]